MEEPRGKKKWKVKREHKGKKSKIEKRERGLRAGWLEIYSKTLCSIT